MLKKNEPKRNLSLTLVFDYFDGSLVDTYRGDNFDQSTFFLFFNQFCNVFRSKSLNKYLQYLRNALHSLWWCND